MLYDRMRKHDIEVGVLEGKRNSITLYKANVGDPMFLCKTYPRVAEPVDEVQPDRKLGFFGEGDGHTTSATAGIENRAGRTNTGAFELAQDLCTSVVFEKRVVIIRPETDGAVFANGVWLNFPQGWPLGPVR